MTTTILLCTDGSELAEAALRAGLAVLAPADRYVVATAIDGPDPAELVGASGMAGPTLTQDEFDTELAAATHAGSALAEETAARLGLARAEARAVPGPAGDALVALAGEVGATALVIGSRGRSGIKRALLGSVSDHVVRHAPCPVVVTHPES